MEPLESQDIAWSPSADMLAQSNLLAFMRSLGVADYDALRQRAAEDMAWFWDAVIRYWDIRFYRPYDVVVDPSRGLPYWREGGASCPLFLFPDGRGLTAQSTVRRDPAPDTAVDATRAGVTRLETGRRYPGPNYISGRMVNQILFLPAQDPMAARWGEDSATTLDSADASALGVDAVYDISHLHEVLVAALEPGAVLRYVRSGEPGPPSGVDDQGRHRRGRLRLALRRLRRLAG